MQRQAQTYSISTRVCSNKITQGDRRGKLFQAAVLVIERGSSSIYLCLGLLSVCNCLIYFGRDMSQAEQVPEDMPAYLNDGPAATGKCCNIRD